MRSWSIPRRLAFSAVVGLVVGGAFGFAYVAANPDKPLANVLLLSTLGIGLIPAAAVYGHFWPSDRLRKQTQNNVETRWVTEASAKAFFRLVALLVYAEVLGDLLHIAWLSPLTILHVGVAAVLAYASAYAAIRHREA